MIFWDNTILEKQSKQLNFVVAMATKEKIQLLAAETTIMTHVESISKM